MKMSCLIVPARDNLPRIVVRCFHGLANYQLVTSCVGSSTKLEIPKGLPETEALKVSYSSFCKQIKNAPPHE